MKVSVAAVAALVLGPCGQQANAEEGGLRALQGRRCANDFKCPVNSYRRPNRDCYNNFNDCTCYTGYYKYKEMCVRDQLIAIDNLSYKQPFSGFFVMAHSMDVEPLYTQGRAATEELALLAENGNPGPLVDRYSDRFGVLDVAAVGDGPLMPAGRTVIRVKTNDDYPLITIATMAINTNDCFTALNGVALKGGDVYNLPGMDSGSEENNELCTSIPGPACPSGSGNVRSGNGEGFVHVHRGFQGINMGREDLFDEDKGASGFPLSADDYDWRNPLMRVTAVKEH